MENNELLSLANDFILKAKEIDPSVQKVIIITSDVKAVPELEKIISQQESENYDSNNAIKGCFPTPWGVVCF